MLAAMSRNLEGVHVGFLRQVMGKNPKRQRDRTWRNVVAEKVLKEAVIQTLGRTLTSYRQQWRSGWR